MKYRSDMRVKTLTNQLSTMDTRCEALTTTLVDIQRHFGTLRSAYEETANSESYDDGDPE